MNNRETKMEHLEQIIETLRDRLADHGLASCPECGAESRVLDCEECESGECSVWICTECEWSSDDTHSDQQ